MSCPDWAKKICASIKNERILLNRVWHFLQSAKKNTRHCSRDGLLDLTKFYQKKIAKMKRLLGNNIGHSSSTFSLTSWQMGHLSHGTIVFARFDVHCAQFPVTPLAPFISESNLLDKRRVFPLFSDDVFFSYFFRVLGFVFGRGVRQELMKSLITTPHNALDDWCRTLPSTSRSRVEARKVEHESASTTPSNTWFLLVIESKPILFIVIVSPGPLSHLALYISYDASLALSRRLWLRLCSRFDLHKDSIDDAGKTRSEWDPVPGIDRRIFDHVTVEKLPQSLENVWIHIELIPTACGVV